MQKYPRATQSPPARKVPPSPVTARKPRSSPTPSPVRTVRKIPEVQRLLLCVRAGGRCEFNGDNKYLFRHSLTLTEGNFSQAAHIVAFSERGPRGRRPSGRVTAEIHDIKNLMLLCAECHKLVDDHPGEYSVRTLRRYKANHERRIEHLTSLKPGSLTTALVLQGNVAGQRFTLPPGQLHEAVAPRYPKNDDPILIDLSSITDAGDDAYLTTAIRKIDEELPRLYADHLDGRRVDHISVFAIASIPVLIYLGSRLSDKVPTDIYQLHRGTENWTWPERGVPAEYAFRTVRDGATGGDAALLLSLSGPIDPASLPASIGPTVTVYELRLASATPNPQFLTRRGDLAAFEREYQLALRVIAQNHPGLKLIHLVPAVPAPVAVTCGRALLRVDPPLLVYDYRRSQGYFPTRTITKGSL
jgi:hypothetical protein